MKQKKGVLISKNGVKFANGMSYQEKEALTKTITEGLREGESTLSKFSDIDWNSNNKGT